MVSNIHDGRLHLCHRVNWKLVLVAPFFIVSPIGGTIEVTTLVELVASVAAQGVGVQWHCQERVD